jgi:DNA-binding NtrC family response regulator
VVEYGEVIRLGSVQPRHVDVRYVAATNRDLTAAIGVGRFRSDLFFRLNGFSVTLPPLRKRERDILPLAQHFLDRIARGRPYMITPEAQRVLEHHSWPGNVRELKNVLERALVLAGAGGRIDAFHLQLPELPPIGADSSHELLSVTETIPPTPYGGRTTPTYPPPYGPGPMIGPTTPELGIPAASGRGASDLKAQRESWEKQQILQALERTSGNQKEAAKLLGVSRRTLINKIEAYGIARPRKR